MQPPQIPNLILYAIPIFVFFILLEIIISSIQKLKTYEFKDAVSSISMGLGNVFIGIISKAIVFGIFLLVYNHFRIFTIPFTWWAWLLILFLDDLTYYWFHRISHES